MLITLCTRNLVRAVSGSAHISEKLSVVAADAPAAAAATAVLASTAEYIFSFIVTPKLAVMEITHPFRCIIAGSSGCGKTVWVSRFLKNLHALCNVRFDRVLLYYAEWQDTYLQEFKIPNDPSLEFREGLTDPSDYSFDNDKRMLFILDDLKREFSNKVISDLFSRSSHHKNLSVLYITQNIFHQGKGQRDISLNAQNMVLFKSPREDSQIRHRAKQVFPEDVKFVQEIFKHATLQPHSYFFLDLS